MCLWVFDCKFQTTWEHSIAILLLNFLDSVIKTCLMHAILVGKNINTLLPSDTERCDYSPMRCWWVTSFYVFLHDVIHMHLSAGVIHFITSRLSIAWCRMFESQVTKKQTGPDPLFLEPQDCNKETIHSGTLSVFL
jgi:hypothetical protein